MYSLAGGMGPARRHVGETLPHRQYARLLLIPLPRRQYACLLSIRMAPPHRQYAWPLPTVDTPILLSPPSQYAHH